MTPKTGTDHTVDFSTRWGKSRLLLSTQNWPLHIAGNELLPFDSFHPIGTRSLILFIECLSLVGHLYQPTPNVYLLYINRAIQFFCFLFVVMCEHNCVVFSYNLTYFWSKSKAEMLWLINAHKCTITHESRIQMVISSHDSSNMLLFLVD